jgi:hypothetical protein
MRKVTSRPSAATVAARASFAEFVGFAQVRRHHEHKGVAIAFASDKGGNATARIEDDPSPAVDEISLIASALVNPIVFDGCTLRLAWAYGLGLEHDLTAPRARRSHAQCVEFFLTEVNLRLVRYFTGAVGRTSTRQRFRRGRNY